MSEAANDEAGLVLAGIHGLPTIGVDPRDQLGGIRLALLEFPRLSLGFRDIAWASATFDDMKNWIRRLKEGAFSRFHAAQFAQQLVFGSGNKIVVIAFSAGGFIFYRWLTEFADPNLDLSAVMISSPLRCDEGVFHFEDDPKQRDYLFNDPRIDAGDIANRLRPGSLTVLIAENDGTVLPHNAMFPPHLVESGAVVQHMISGTTHRTVCNDRVTHHFILDHIRRQGIHF